MNELDDISPESQVSRLEEITIDTTFRIEWSGSDNLSGIRHYDLYAIENDTIAFAVALGIEETSYEFTGTNGSKYMFYTVATDSAGNVETITGIDTETTIDMTTGQEKFLRDLGITPRIYPNPASETILIEFNLDKELKFRFQVSDIAGQLVILSEEKLYSPVLHLESLSIGDLSPGIYFTTITTMGFC